MAICFTAPSPQPSSPSPTLHHNLTHIHIPSARGSASKCRKHENTMANTRPTKGDLSKNQPVRAKEFDLTRIVQYPETPRRRAPVKKDEEEPAAKRKEELTKAQNSTYDVLNEMTQTIETLKKEISTTREECKKAQEKSKDLKSERNLVQLQIDLDRLDHAEEKQELEDKIARLEKELLREKRENAANKEALQKFDRAKAKCGQLAALMGVSERADGSENGAFAVKKEPSA
ncbi:hypothetical protein K491DRAFT_763015 [Lophiostoma macrostomum CBS 122681]|uniref:Uncharacterized protein n=1 Tax=Lophiostoma macrostomum CBS 122681 TaxID=1314788 RepID=A0A6A6SQ88_9PLEO|nr:hypothetical protein K491DRAFT_763015 [Lophiostoma macrostomum CBS 122681]